MSFAQLQKAIYKEAKKRADEIDADYHRRLAVEEERIKKEARMIEEGIMDRVRSEAMQKARFIHQEEKLLSKSQVLKAKQEEIESIRTEAKSQIINWDDEKAKKLIKKLIDLVPDNAEGEILPGGAHKKWIIQYAGKKGLKISDEEIANEGGLIYRGNNIEINVTVGRLVDQLFSRRRSEIAKVLFE